MSREEGKSGGGAPNAGTGGAGRRGLRWGWLGCGVIQIWGDPETQGSPLSPKGGDRVLTCSGSKSGGVSEVV